MITFNSKLYNKYARYSLCVIVNSYIPFCNKHNIFVYADEKKTDTNYRCTLI